MRGMRGDELAAEVRAWAHTLTELDDPRWERFDVCARELARLVERVAAPSSATCRGCGAAVPTCATVAAIVYGDPRGLRQQVATREGRADVWSRLWLVAALLDGFCSELCATAAGAARRRPSRDTLAARRRRRRRLRGAAETGRADRGERVEIGDDGDELAGAPFEGLGVGLRLR